MEKIYDVFISFKNSDATGNMTKDRDLAEKCYRFLTARGLNVFFSEIELANCGESQYQRAIDAALDSSRFLIAVGCSHDNFNSGWVRYEWESFLNEIRSGTKPNGELFVLYQGMEVKDLPRPLKQQQAFNASEDDALDKLFNFIRAALLKGANANNPKEDKQTMAGLKEGQVINTANYQTVKVLRASKNKVELGRGGQGIVYKVEYDGKPMALKWYFKNKMKNPQKFYDNIKNNIKVGRPTEAFLWPVDLTEWVDDTFGYIMPLKPDEYTDFSKYLLAKVNFKSDTALINAALNIVDGFMRLHFAGFNYQDLNDGNFFINFENGDVLICDNDNVMGQGFFAGIAGKCRYMAPEIVRGEKMPDKLTDRFSLSVVLFMLLFSNHPLEGRLTVKADEITTEADEKRFYGTDPVFIFDPKDTRNAPNKLTSANAIKLWGLVPEYIRNLFIESFEYDRLHGTKPQVLESTWLKAFIRWRSEIITCGCGVENYADATGGFICSCGKKRRVPARLKFPKEEIPLYPGIALYACNTIADSDDFRTKTAEVITNPKDPKVLGIKNLSGTAWTVTGADGVSTPKGQNEVVRIADGTTINFRSNFTAEILANK